MLKSLRFDVHPPFQLTDQVTLNGEKYFVIAIQWELTSELIQRVQLTKRDRYGRPDVPSPSREVLA